MPPPPPASQQTVAAKFDLSAEYSNSSSSEEGSSGTSPANSVELGANFSTNHNNLEISHTSDHQESETFLSEKSDEITGQFEMWEPMIGDDATTVVGKYKFYFFVFETMYSTSYLRPQYFLKCPFLMGFLVEVRQTVYCTIGIQHCQV